MRFFWHVPEPSFETNQVSADINAIEKDLPGGRLNQTCEHLDCCRLSRSVWPKVSRHLAGFHRKTDLIDYGHATVTLSELPHFECLHGMYPWNYIVTRYSSRATLVNPFQQEINMVCERPPPPHVQLWAK